MKILQIADGYGQIGSEIIGPVERVIFEVSRNLVLLGHEVTILERKKVGQDNFENLFGIDIVRVDKPRGNGSVFFDLNSAKNLSFLLLDGLMFAHSIIDYLKHSQKDFDIIHFHLPLSGIPFSLFSPNRWRSRLIFTSHSDEMRLGLSKYGRLPILFRLFHPDIFLMKRADRSVVLNPLLRRKLVDYYDLDFSRVFAIHNGIDAGSFVFSLENHRQNVDFDFLGKKVILFVGLVIPRKGVEYLIKAVNILVNSYHLNNLVLILVVRKVQDKMCFQRIKQLVEQYGLIEHVRFVGRVDYTTLAFLYNQCDIFVLPSLEEGFGLVATEAMSFSKPVIGTNVGGIPLQIVDGWNGFLVEPANPLQLAEKLRYLLDNEVERLRMGKNSKTLSEQKFNWKNVAVEYEKVYLSINKPCRRKN